MFSDDPLVKIALNQKITWEKFDGENHYGQPRYKDPVEIDCRISYKSRLVIDKTGTEVRSGARITTLEPVEISDRLTVRDHQYIVISVEIPVDFDGKEHRRKAYI